MDTSDTGGGLYSVLVSLSFLAGFWLLHKRLSTRTGNVGRRLLAAAVLLGMPTTPAVYGMTMWIYAFQTKAWDYKHWEAARVQKATANVFHAVNLGNIFTWNPRLVEQYELRIAADDPSTLLLTRNNRYDNTEEQEVVSYSFSTRELRRKVAAETWQAGRCVVLNNFVHEYLDQPADDEDLILNGKRFRKSSDVWTGYLLAANGSYLALFSAPGTRRAAPRQGSMWYPRRVWQRSRRSPTTVDVYRVRDAVRVGSATYVAYTPDLQLEPFWVDNRILFVSVAVDLRGSNEVLLADLPPEPPQPIPLRSDWRNLSQGPWEESIVNSCPEDPGVDLVSMREVPQRSAKGYFRGVTTEVRIRLQKPLPFPYKLIARWHRCETASEADNLDAGEHVLSLFVGADDWSNGCGEVKSLRLIPQDPSGEVPTPLRVPIGTWGQYRPEMFPEENRPLAEDQEASKRIEQIPADALGRAVVTVVEASRQKFAQLRGERVSQTDAEDREATVWRAKITIPEADSCVIRNAKDYWQYECTNVLPGIEPAGIQAALRAYGEKLRRATGLKDRGFRDREIVFDHESGAMIALVAAPSGYILEAGEVRIAGYKRLELYVFSPRKPNH